MIEKEKLPYDIGVHGMGVNARCWELKWGGCLVQLFRAMMRNRYVDNNYFKGWRAMFRPIIIELSCLPNITAINFINNNSMKLA